VGRPVDQHTSVEMIFGTLIPPRGSIQGCGNDLDVLTVSYDWRAHLLAFDGQHLCVARHLPISLQLDSSLGDHYWGRLSCWRHGSASCR
jgi:hypothetical protein